MSHRTNEDTKPTTATNTNASNHNNHNNNNYNNNNNNMMILPSTTTLSPSLPAMSAAMFGMGPNPDPTASMLNSMLESSARAAAPAPMNNPPILEPSQSLQLGLELKRLQQLQQLQQLGVAAAPMAAAFPAAAATTTPQFAANQTTQLLQSMLDQQKPFNQLLATSNSIAPLLQQSALLPDHSRLLLAQGQFGAGLLPQLVGGGAAAAGLMGATGDSSLLPSPHSLLNRDGLRKMRGGVIEPFPEKLHRLLTEVEAAGHGDIISFVANGRAFAIHKPDKFFQDIVPIYFRQSRLSSFKRQLNLYGFELINTGPSRGGYFHELFVKDRPELCRRMRRVAVKVAASKKSTKQAPGGGGAAAGDDAASATGSHKTDSSHNGDRDERSV